jgi:Flp pilus assembly protein TadD
MRAARVVVVFAVFFALVGSARADDSKKKNPGLLDFGLGNWKTPAGHEREAAKQLAPGSLDLAPAISHAGPPRPVRLRIYADADYRQAVLRWQKKARGQIDRLNRVVGPVFGVSFEIESLREWDRAHGAAPLGPVLSELEALDPARDVDWVIGLVTPFRGVAASMHEIGEALSPSRYFVLRGMDDEQEGQALDREFRLLSPDERGQLYSDRKAHKEIVVFLHEWAHTMGALHHEDRAVIMNPLYDPKQAAFSDFEKRLIALVLDRRLGRPNEAYPEGADLELLLHEAPADEGTERDREVLAGLVRQRAAHGGGGAGRDVAPGAASGDARGLAEQAAVHVRAGELTQAAPLVLAAAGRLDAGADGALALRVAALAGEVGALTTGEAALARIGRRDGELSQKAFKLGAELESARRRLALPRDAARWGVPPDKEPAFAQAFWAASHAASGGDPAAARARLHDFAAAYPDAPGTDLLACEVELRARRAAAAGKRCQAAVAKFEETARAHYLLGIVAEHAGREEVAEKELRRAILLDPAEPSAWTELGHLYRVTRASGRLDELRAQHQALLSSPLPE